jgi:hypothetical protein
MDRDGVKWEYCAVELGGETVDVVERRFREQGWYLVEVVRPINASTTLIMKRAMKATE